MFEVFTSQEGGGFSEFRIVALKGRRRHRNFQVKCSRQKPFNLLPGVGNEMLRVEELEDVLLYGWDIDEETSAGYGPSGLLIRS